MTETYRYNTDGRMDAEYRSLGEVKASQRWRSDTNRYVFTKYTPTFVDGADSVLITFTSITELVDHLHTRTNLPKTCIFKYKNGSLKLSYRGGDNKSAEVYLGDVGYRNSKAKVPLEPYTMSF